MDNVLSETEAAQMKLFPDENPNPVLRVSREGILLYSNRASQSLLDFYGCAVAGQAPPVVREWVEAALASGDGAEHDYTCGDRVVSFMVSARAHLRATLVAPVRNVRRIVARSWVAFAH